MNLKTGEQLDTLKHNGLKIIQNKEKFMFGIDAFLVADFAELRNGDEVVDLGTGTGIIPFLLAPGRASHISALEIQEESCDMVRRSVEINNLQEKISVIQGDIKNAHQIFGGNFCNVVISNPPYMTSSSGKLNPNDCKNIARHEILCNLEDVVKAASKILKSSGRFYMIHRPNRLQEILVFFEKYKLVTRRLQFIHPFKDKEATMLLIEARKTGSPDVKILPPLVMYDSPGNYTKEIQAIYDRI